MTLIPGKLYCLSNSDVVITLNHFYKRHVMDHNKPYLLTKITVTNNTESFMTDPDDSLYSIYWFLIDKLEYGTVIANDQALLAFKEYT